MRILDTILPLETEGDLARLFLELGKITGIDSLNFPGISVLSLLQLTLQPKGSLTKIIKLDKRRIDAVAGLEPFVVMMNVGKVDNGLHRLLREIAGTNEHLDYCTHHKVYVFLNRHLPNLIKPSKRSGH